MTKLYNIVLNPGHDQRDLYSLVSNVKDELLYYPKFFQADCTDEQVKALENHEAVNYCLCEDDIEHPVDAVSKQINYIREHQNTHTVGSFPDGKPLGNWGLIRHQSQTNNTSFNTVSNSQYNNAYIGEGVDIVLQIESVLKFNDPEFLTLGTSRVQNFQWNSLSGMHSLSTVNYALDSTTVPVDSHAEAVAYITASNTYGWATGAKIYIWPRNQMGGFMALHTHAWQAIKSFHQNKGNSRPTIVVDAYEWATPTAWGSGASSVIFRDQIYSEIAPAGAPLTSADRHRIFNGGINAYGNSSKPPAFQMYTVPGGSSMDAKALTAQNRTDILNRISDRTNAIHYPVYIEPLEDMIEAGVHHVSAAGNNSAKIALPDNIDHNNGVLVYNRENPPGVGLFHALCREGLSIAGDTIAVASLSTQFGVDSGLNNKETLSTFSNRGDRVDACAAGEGIYMVLGKNGKYEAKGTSFASPNLGGMAACVLGKYPTTTPAQLRKYFRDHAVGTDTLYDTGTQPIPSSNVGDSPYYSDTLGLRGYSGKIAYLDPNLAFNPSTISDTSITSTETVSADNKINYTIAQINTKLGSI